MVYKTIAKDTAIYGAGDFIGRLINFVTFPIIASVLSPKEFGSLDLVLTIVSLAALVMGCGLNNAAQRYYWDEVTNDSERKIIISTALYIQLIIGAVIVVVVYLILTDTYPIIESMLNIGWMPLLLALLLIPLTQLHSYIRDTTRLHFRPINYLILSVCLNIVASTISIIAIVIYRLGYQGYIYAYFCSLFIFLPLGLWMIRKDLIFSVDKKWARKILNYGHPFLYVIFAHWIFGSIDRWMLATMSSITETGIYSIAFRFASIVVFFATAFGLAWSPIAIKIKSEHTGEYRYIYGVVLLFLIFMMISIVGLISLFSGEILYLLMPAEYHPATLSLIILCFGFIFQATTQITASGISLSEKTKYFAYLAWITAIINVIGNYYLVPLYGANGAATSTAISYILLTILYGYITQKLHPIEFQYKKMFTFSVIGFCIFIISVFLMRTTIDGSILFIKIFTFASVMCIGLLILPRDEIRKLV